jgi:hypothetical protein
MFNNLVTVEHTDRPRSLAFTIGCCIYISAVIATFIFGLIKKDPDGVSFIPTIVVTLPWFFAPMDWIPHWAFSALTAFYDLPLFLLSAFLNLCIADLLCRYLRFRR